MKSLGKLHTSFVEAESWWEETQTATAPLAQSMTIDIGAPKAARIRLVTLAIFLSVAVANRSVRLLINRGQVPIYQMEPSQTAAALALFTVNFALGADGEFRGPLIWTIPIPDIIHQNPTSISATIVNAQVNDQLTGGSVVAQVWR